MTGFKNLSRSVVVASILLAGIVGGICLDTPYRLLPLGDDQLAAATGRDPYTISTRSDSCAELQAGKYTNAVPEDGCHSENDGSICVSCDSLGTNVQLQVATANFEVLPGLVRQPNEACGKENFGACKVVGTSSVCDNPRPTTNQCQVIEVRHNQPAQ